MEWRTCLTISTLLGQKLLLIELNKNGAHLILFSYTHSEGVFEVLLKKCWKTQVDAGVMPILKNIQFALHWKKTHICQFHENRNSCESRSTWILLIGPNELDKQFWMVRCHRPWIFLFVYCCCDLCLFLTEY